MTISNRTAADLDLLEIETAYLTDPQKVALANRLVLAIRDTSCVMQLNVVARNAADTAQQLARDAFVAANDARRIA